MGANQNLNLVAQRGLSRAEAARYVGVGVKLFNQLIEEDRMPPARAMGGCHVWDIRELDDAFDQLPHIGDDLGKPAGKAPASNPEPPQTDFV